MESMQLLTVALAALLFLAAAYRRGGRHAGSSRILPAAVEVRDADVARRMIIDHAETFSDHPAVPFPVDLDAGYPKTTSINSAPYGPLWRALRRNLTAGVLHPSRLRPHLAVSLQRDAAAAAIVEDLLAVRAGAGGEVVVVVRDALYAAVFGFTARMCFGDAPGEPDLRVMQRTLREFFHSGIDARLLASSRLARLLRWRQWRYLVVVGTRRRLAEVFTPAIEERRRSRLRDGSGGGVRSYVDTLLDVRVPGGGDGEPAGARRALRDDEMVRLVWEFLGAGTETVAACVEWTLARLATSPEVQEKLHRELVAASDQRKSQVPEERHRDLPPYLRAVILESLRLHLPVPFVLRDVDVGADGVAAVGAAPPPDDGSPVRIMFMAEDTGRNSKAWTDPDEFRPERFLAGGEGEDVGPVPGPKEIKMMPFRVGRRHCPGAGMAMANVGCFVAALIREFEWAPPVGGAGVDLMATHALFLKVMASPLRARITPRTR